jgi:hypothetical protein
MARRTRGNTISGRVDEVEHEKIVEYADKAHVAVADIVRLAVEEYMVNHPINEED